MKCKTLIPFIMLTSFLFIFILHQPLSMKIKKMHTPLLFHHSSIIHDSHKNDTFFHVYMNNQPRYIPILMFHDIKPSQANSMFVSPRHFRRQLIALKEAGYTTILPEDLIDYEKGKKPLPEKPVLLTFDDGYKNNYTYAYPILKSLNMKATIFVIVSSIGKKFGNDIEFISWDNIREMTNSNVISIQTHTYAWHTLVPTKHGEKSALISKLDLGNGTKESESDYEKRISEDFLLAKQTIEAKTNRPVFCLAYPYGAYNKTTEKIAKRLGYTMTFTVHPGTNRIDRSSYELKRITISGKESPHQIVYAIQMYE